MGRCAIGNYLFEDALPITDQPYQQVTRFDSRDFKGYETFENVTSNAESLEYKKEKWYIHDGIVHTFYLWKRIS